MGLIGLIGPIGLIGLIGHIGLIGLIGHIGLISLMAPLFPNFSLFSFHFSLISCPPHRKSVPLHRLILKDNRLWKNLAACNHTKKC